MTKKPCKKEQEWTDGTSDGQRYADAQNVIIIKGWNDCCDSWEAYLKSVDLEKIIDDSDLAENAWKYADLCDMEGINSKLSEELAEAIKREILK